MRARATMRDVAALAGVSLKTVSRVVNLETGVSENLIDRVRVATEQLDYRHNLAASNLRRHEQRTGSIAVLVQDLSNGYSADLLRSIDDAFRERNVVVLSASLDEEEDRERQLIDNLIRRRVDGLIMMPASHDQSYLQAEMRAGFAVVIIDRPPSHIMADSVLVDNTQGACQGTLHLISAGHRRIAAISDEHRIATARDRYAGYVQAMNCAGLVIDESLVCTARTDEESVAAVRGLFDLPNPPTAIFSARNTITAKVVRTLRELDLSRSVALVGFDDIPMADLVDPAITVVRQKSALVGRTAARLLQMRLDGDDSAVQSIVLSPELIVRGSGEIRPLTS